MVSTLCVCKVNVNANASVLVNVNGSVAAPKHVLQFILTSAHCAHNVSLARTQSLTRAGASAEDKCQCGCRRKGG